jgi:predicted CoA-substrate-specific enzyme activase
MEDTYFLGVDCGSVSLNLVLSGGDLDEPLTVYARTQGRPLDTFVSAVDDLMMRCGGDIDIAAAFVTGSGRELLSQSLGIPPINEITAHAVGAYRVDPRVRTIIEIGGQDSKFIRIDPPEHGNSPRIASFRMNEICAAGTGAFLDEQAGRLEIPIDSFGSVASQSEKPASIAGRCAVFAKTDMIHQAQEGTPLPDILLGVAFALVRNYTATLIRGDSLVPMVSLQGGVMSNGAVVRAFRELLGLSEAEMVIPPHFKVLGAMGCAVLAEDSGVTDSVSLSMLGKKASKGHGRILGSSLSTPLSSAQHPSGTPSRSSVSEPTLERPLVMGLDVGSVSVKGVVIDRFGTIIREDYRLSRGRPLEALEDVILALLPDETDEVDRVAVTGSGRLLVGRLLEADLIVNEISAQARAAVSHDPDVDTIVEIGGQDSKWIALEHGALKNFEMNRVCAAGTGSFLMEQADRLGLPMGREFSDEAFSSRSPSDLGTRCTVFMESDLIHHQNNGSSREDLAAGVCISIVRNYLERVANHRPLGDRVMFLGGVAANPAVKAAFEQQTGRSFESPPFYRVSGALGAALSVLDTAESQTSENRTRNRSGLVIQGIEKDRFNCNGCANQCFIDRYRPGGRTFFHGGRCDRWELAGGSPTRRENQDPFVFRASLLESVQTVGSEHDTGPEADLRITDSSVDTTWGILRSPQYYELFPFWKAYCESLGISLRVAPPPDRRQFEAGTRFIRVETCLPMKAMAGQLRDLANAGIKTVFHPAVLSEQPLSQGGRAVEHCPYIQASSQFFKGTFGLQWREPVINHQLDDDAFRNEHIRFARELGFSGTDSVDAVDKGLAQLAVFNEAIEKEGRRLVDSVPPGEQALMVLGKPYHTSEPFLNMNLGGLFQKIGVKAIPGDLFPVESFPTRSPLAWKHQLRMLAVTRVIASDPRFFPAMVTFFGCGPDPFTMRHIRESLKGKPLLVLEMDEHSSRAGLMTRIEAFLDNLKQPANEGVARGGEGLSFPVSQIPRQVKKREGPQVDRGTDRPIAGGSRKRGRVDTVYIPNFGDHAYAFAGAARSMGIEAHVLSPPDGESERLGRPHLMGGECHPYALMLGDYLRLAQDLSPKIAKRSVFCLPGYSACRLGQYPVYIEKVRKECGYPMRVIADLSQALTAFGLSKKHRETVLLRTWEGLNAYDVLLNAYLQVRPRVKAPSVLEAIYADCRDKVFESLSGGEVFQGLEDALHELHQVPADDDADRPIIAVTGDYYTRIVPYANNEVFREIESLGGTVWAPPTFSDGLKVFYHQEVMKESSAGSLADDFEAVSSFYASVVLSELRIKGSPSARRSPGGPLDPLGRRMRRSAATHMDSRFPPGIAAPLATALSYIDRGADGVLNLITLNCSYGTVVTAALLRALKERPEVPLLTLVYDGLKKTNEKTRLEAFMEQVRDHFDGTDGKKGTTGTVSGAIHTSS